MVIEFKTKYDLNNNECVKDLIENSVSGIYETTNEHGEKVVLKIENGIKMIVKTYQKDMKVKIETYVRNGKKGYMKSEMFEGRWKYIE